LNALYQTEQAILTASHALTLTGGLVEQVAGTEEGQATTPAEVPPLLSDYERFSMAFEIWAAENRTLFVIVSIGAVLLVLAILSSFQKKIK